MQLQTLTLETLMKPGKKIAILVHATAQRSVLNVFRLFHCARIWQELGFEIEVIRGPHPPQDAELLFPQVDLSVLPDDYRSILGSFPAVVNRNILDIRKSAFSRNLLRRDDRYKGPVIVKTDANFGGIPELCIQARKLQDLPSRQQWQRDLAKAQSSLATTPVMDPKSYPLFPSLQQVPRAVFDNPHLIVEKYLPEREGEYYFLRSYAFLGSEGITVRTRSRSPVIKGSNGTDLEFVPVDETIVEARKALGFDYGKFDYVLHDGRAVLLDTNATPSFGNAYSPEVRELITTTLARGIGQWFPDGCLAGPADGPSKGPIL